MLEKIKLNHGTEIFVPNDIKQMSNFVLKEQGDWFEDEIGFVRTLVTPSMNALDIGANFGLYSCAIAEQLKQSNDNAGQLWCYEPTPSTADALRQTLVVNGFDTLAAVQELGLSDHTGSASFYTHDNPELNSLTQETEGAQKVTIQLSTLDEEMAKHDWPSIDFIKLDAEGEEVKILEGGSHFLEKNDPVLMVEFEHSGKKNYALLEELNELGFDLYRFSPTLGALVRYQDEMDMTLVLNLFAIRPSQREPLIERGLMVSQAAPEQGSLSITLEGTIANKTSKPALNSNQDYLSCLGLYGFACDDSKELNMRYYALNQACMQAVTLIKTYTKPEEQMSLAGILYAGGIRSLAIKSYLSLIETFSKGLPGFSVSAAFIQPMAGLKAPSTQTDEATVLAWILETWIRQGRYSCYFGEKQNLFAGITTLKQLDMASPHILQAEKALQELATTLGS